MMDSVFRLFGLTQRSNKPLARDKGQGAMVAVALITLVAMISMGIALSASSVYNARRTITTQESLQLYYVAQAGIQEVMATRFIPKSNFLNFYQLSGGTPANNPPYYGLSGRVFRDPSNLTGLVGYYRYLVLGGDQAAYRNTGLWTGPGSPGNRYALSFNLPPEQPVFVVSKGSICVNPDSGALLVDDITVQLVSGSPRPQCTTGELQELTVIAEMDLRRVVDPNNDIVTSYRVFKTDPTAPLSAADDPNLDLVQAPNAAMPVFVPNQGCTDPGTGPELCTRIRFEQAWRAGNGTTVNGRAIEPQLVVFYSSFNAAIEQSVAIGGTQTNIGPPTTPPPVGDPLRINPRSAIKVFFNGGIDVRTIHIDPRNNEDPYIHCLGNPAATPAPIPTPGPTATRCTIQVWEDIDMDNVVDACVGAGCDQLYTSLDQLALSPEGQNYVLMMPPLANSSQLIGTNRHYIIRIGDGLADWQGNHLPTPYQISFWTE